MFTPKYTITNRILANIKRISALVTELNARRFPKVVLMDLHRVARAVSSYASTSIEGNPLPLTEVKKILKTKPMNIRNSEREVLNYNHALTTLENKLAEKNFQLTLTEILMIHQNVIEGLLPEFETGKLRQKPVVVNDPRTGQIVYMPPDAELVTPLMNDLVDFVEREKATLDPLIIAGIFHKQMVLIHPFMDGNGRTTRLATKALLADMGLNTFNLFSFENYYNQNVSKYFKTVGEFGDYYDLVSSVDFTNWLEYFTEGIIDELLRVEKQLPTISLTPDTRLEEHHQAIINFIRNNGYITDRDYAKLTDRAKATRTLDFQKLISLGMIVRKGKGKSTYYTFGED